MTDLETITRLLTPCARCGVAAPDLDGFYPDLCRPCTDKAYGEELTGLCAECDTQLQDDVCPSCPPPIP